MVKAKAKTKAIAKVKKAAAAPAPPAPEPQLTPEKAVPSSEMVLTDPQVAEVVQRDSIQSLTTVMSTEDLAAAIDVQKSNRALLIDFVREQLVSGVDYGPIHISKNCPDKYEPKNCKLSGHWTKDCLFKPGQEKIFSLLGITSELEIDRDTLEMLGNPKGTIAYLCKMYKGSANLGSGRGSCDVGSNNRDANSATKVAEKRARMDACLSLGFSEFFTQDMDDPDYRKDATEATPPTREAAPAPPPEDTPELKAAKKFLTDNHIKNTEMMFAWIKRLLVSYGIESPDMMKATIAANVGDTPGKVEFVELIKRLREGKFTRATQTEEAATEPPKVDEVDYTHDEDQTPEMPPDFLIDIGHEDDAELPPEPTQDSPAPSAEYKAPEVTEQLKSALIMHLDSLGLSGWGKCQFLVNATGRLAITNLKTDKEWQALHFSIMQVLNAEKEIPEDWFAKDTTATPQQESLIRDGYIGPNGEVVINPYKESKEVIT